jgi:hypothetical protein
VVGALSARRLDGAVVVDVACASGGADTLAVGATDICGVLAKGATEIGGSTVAATAIAG